MASAKTPSRPPPSKKPGPDPIEVVELLGVEYFIAWELLDVGSSFFLPTTATVKQALRALQPYAEALDIELAIKSRCEYGRYGVRVWRSG